MHRKIIRIEILRAQKKMHNANGTKVRQCLKLKEKKENDVRIKKKTEMPLRI